jgi:hypothetical protein
MPHTLCLVFAASLALLLSACGGSAYTGSPPEPEDYDRACEVAQDCALITYSTPCSQGCTARLAVAKGDEDRARADVDAYVEHYASGAGQCTADSECYWSIEAQVGCADEVCVVFVDDGP